MKKKKTERKKERKRKKEKEKNIERKKEKKKTEKVAASVIYVPIQKKPFSSPFVAQPYFTDLKFSVTPTEISTHFDPFTSSP